MDPDNSCIRLLAPSVMYLSIQEGTMFGEGPPLQTLAPNKWSTLNVVLFATETVPKAGLYPVLSFPKKKLMLDFLKCFYNKDKYKLKN